MTEDEFINNFLRPLSKECDSGLGLLDDAACLSLPPSEELIISKDMILSEQHFFPNDPPKDIAHKAIATNISDIISKGAEPFAYMLGLALPENTSKEWAEEFTEGLADAQKNFAISLIGGDTTGTKGPLCISVTIFGKCNKGQMIKRSGANEGDLIFVTGTLGDSYLGLKLIQNQISIPQDKFSVEYETDLKQKFLRPNPPVTIREILATNATSAMDLSDGLINDLEKLCRASNCGAEIKIENIPLSSAAEIILSHDPTLESEIFGWGDDYQILFTIRPEQEKAMIQDCEERGVKIKKIGKILSKPNNISYLDREGYPVSLKGNIFSHF